MGDDHDPGRVGAVGVVPADVRRRARCPTPGPAVPYGATMSMPLWKCAQLPNGGSHAKPVQPNCWVTVPGIGQRSVPLNFDGMWPRLYWRATRRLIRFSSLRFAAAVATSARWSASCRRPAACSARFCAASAALAACLELLELRLRLLELVEPLVELLLLDRGLLAQRVRLAACRLDRLVEREQRLAVLGDLRGERLVLLGRVELGAHPASMSVNEAPERNVSSIDVRSASYASRIRFASSALRVPELRLLRRLLGLDVAQLVVEVAELVDELLVLGLDLVDRRRQPGDLLAGRDQVVGDARRARPWSRRSGRRATPASC